MNSTFIHGRITKDPELKSYTNAKGESGSVCNFSVAVGRRMGEETDFFNCKCFGKRAEVIEKFFKKGKEIVVSGEMQCRKYQDKDGNNRTAWELNVMDFDFCGKKGDSASTDSAQDGMVEINPDDYPF